MTASTVEDAHLAERFLTAWKRLENHLVTQRGAQGPGGDMSDVLRWAERSHQLTPSAVDFLQTCRRARNAYAHIAFEGYSGPVTLPPRPVVERLERLTVATISPGRAMCVARAATMCQPTTTVHSALETMAQHDHSQLPYRHADHGWVLFTRAQVSRLVDSATGADGVSLVDLSVPVSALISFGHPLGAQILPRSAPATVALDALETSLVTPDDQAGGYPALLLADGREDARPPAILTADDLPALYDLLGR